MVFIGSRLKMKMLTFVMCKSRRAVEEVKIQGGKVLNACREVQIQVQIYHNNHFEDSHFVDAVGGVDG